MRRWVAAPDACVQQGWERSPDSYNSGHSLAESVPASMTTKKRITLKELAESMGVHSSTVSRVMNPGTRHLIGDEVVERVLKAARQLNYSPNRTAATLRTKRSDIVGVVLPDISNP